MPILNPKQFIKTLSSNKINFKLVGAICFIYVLTVSLNFFGFNSAFNDLVSLVKSTLVPLNQLYGAEKSLAIFRISRDMIFMFGAYLFLYIGSLVLLNLLVKGVAAIFKKDISFISLINISIYSFLAARILNLLLFVIVILTYLFVKNFTENQTFLFIELPIFLINILSFGLYIYGVTITTKSKIRAI